MVRRVGGTEQSSVSSSTKLDEASVHSTARCHSHPHEFSVEVDKDDRGVPSKVPVQSSPFGSIGMQVMSRVLHLRNLVGAKWRIWSSGV